MSRGELVVPWDST